MLKQPSGRLLSLRIPAQMRERCHQAAMRQHELLVLVERLLGRKTMEVEILKEALAKAQAKKPSLQLASPPKDAFR